MTSSHPFIRILLWAVAAYHIGMGALLFYSGELSIRAADSFYGWSITGSPDLGIISEILGCYGIAFGLMMIVVASDPVKYRAILSVAIILFALRLLQRAVYAPKVMEVFEVSTGQYWGGFVFVLAFAAVLIWVRLQLGREAGGAVA